MSQALGMSEVREESRSTFRNFLEGRERISQRHNEEQSEWAAWRGWLMLGLEGKCGRSKDHLFVHSFIHSSIHPAHSSRALTLG